MYLNVSFQVILPELLILHGMRDIDIQNNSFQEQKSILMDSLELGAT